jgi:hypothetical protein
MTFLRARRSNLTSLFWADLEDEVERRPRDLVPLAIAELARGDVSVVCDREEAETALAWTRAQPYWPSLPTEREPP